VLLLSSAAYRVSWRVRAGGALRLVRPWGRAGTSRFTPGNGGSPAPRCMRARTRNSAGVTGLSQGAAGNRG